MWIIQKETSPKEIVPKFIPAGDPNFILCALFFVLSYGLIPSGLLSYGLISSRRYDLAITIFSLANTFKIPKLIACLVAWNLAKSFVWTK